MFNMIKGRMLDIIQSFLYGYGMGCMSNIYKPDQQRIDLMYDTLFGKSESNVVGNRNGKPVWLSIIPDNEWYMLSAFIGKCVYELSKITPFSSTVINNFNNELIGYIIVLPSSFHEHDDICKFVIGHELGHIMLGHLDSGKKGVLNDIEKEIAADKYAMEYSGFDIGKCRTVMKDMFDLIFKTTYLNMPIFKETRNVDAKVELIRNSNKSCRKRSKAL